MKPGERIKQTFDMPAAYRDFLCPMLTEEKLSELRNDDVFVFFPSKCYRSNQTLELKIWGESCQQDF